MTYLVIVYTQPGTAQFHEFAEYADAVVCAKNTSRFGERKTELLRQPNIGPAEVIRTYNNGYWH